MNDAIRPQPGIMDIALYEGGKAAVAGVTNVLKLSSNENPFGPSDKAKDAFARSVHQLHRYPSTDHASLRQAIAEVHGLDAARVICGVGSDEIITFLCQAYAGAEGRGGVHRTRLPDVSHLGPGSRGHPGRSAPSAIAPPMSMPSCAPVTGGPSWCSSPTRTTPPAR